MKSAFAEQTPQRAASRSSVIDDCRELVADDLAATDTLIEQRLHSEVVLVNQVASHIIHSGGKRLRPLVVLLAARACDYPGHAHHDLAAIIEFIHTATLLHDDVVDNSSLRRGQSTANAAFGNSASVLVGDFLYSRAFQMMVGVGSMRVMQVLADTTNAIAEGEVLQLLNCHDPDTDEACYRRVIEAKTARLFEAGARLGAIVQGVDGTLEEALASYGRHLGLAFQLTDDVLDYQGDPAAIGKNVGDDLAEGKPTLPLIQAIRHGNEAQQRLLRAAITGGGRAQIDAVIDAVESTGAIQYTADAAAEEAEHAARALAPLPDSRYKEALRQLADFSVRRDY
ncbi:MAG: polyprenyl synthetase family protein [Gammaproteobacteria bacterium]|nr:polyprenyl synthetase family protein [Gammaproteobacteria bacterium]